MEKFDLEQAKAGKPVCTRDGRKVQIYDYNFAGYKIMGGEPRCNIAGKIIIDKEHEVIRIWEPNGNVYLSGLMDDSDLMMATEKHQVIEILGKRLKIVQDESDSTDFCYICAAKKYCWNTTGYMLFCTNAEGKMNRHFELIEIKEEK